MNSVDLGFYPVRFMCWTTLLNIRYFISGSLRTVKASFVANFQTFKTIKIIFATVHKR